MERLVLPYVLVLQSQALENEVNIQIFDFNSHRPVLVTNEHSGPGPRLILHLPESCSVHDLDLSDLNGPTSGIMILGR